MASSLPHLDLLRQYFGERMQMAVSLKRFTAARLGGTADVLVSAGSSAELSYTVERLWMLGIPFVILGRGSNVLVADAGVRQVVVLNRAQKVSFDAQSVPPVASVESGANLGSVARRAGALGLSGLEWAAGIPGTVGGAVYGNAGAHGANISSNLLMAEILHLNLGGGAEKHEILREKWTVDRFEFAYRTSLLKRQPGKHVILAAQLQLDVSTPELVKAKMDEFNRSRLSSQPSGASLGSIFKNPEGDYAGRLIEAAGLKGRQIGKVEISQKHANFFISRDSATASDYAALIRLAQEQVQEKFGVSLELEIELLGDWPEN
ncbi:MAG: UDP-N-acetylmuramate dehydrogenase [Acidobacteriaceae bacterium]